VGKIIRGLGYGLGAIALLLLLFALWAWFSSSQILARTHEPRPETLARPSAAQLADAGRQARILGCVSCHGEGLSGRMMFDGGPFAKVWAPNINELAGRASDQQLAQAIRQGISHDGRALFVMPSPMYSRLSDQEVAALIVWIRALPRRGQAVSPIQWGAIGRVVLALGKLPSAVDRIDEFRVRQPFDTGPEHAAGRQLAAKVCSECHGPDLSGGQPTPDQAAPGLSMVGAYDLDQFTRLVRKGVSPSGRDLGLMREIAVNDTSHLTDEEVAQLYSYLRSRSERVQDPVETD
jgi:mono/diheme cytochrome c family protein